MIEAGKQAIMDLRLQHFSINREKVKWGDNWRLEEANKRALDAEKNVWKDYSRLEMIMQDLRGTREGLSRELVSSSVFFGRKE